VVTGIFGAWIGASMVSAQAPKEKESLKSEE
jgi:hypothetical protein